MAKSKPQPPQLKGGVLRPNAATQANFQRAWLALIDEMTRETKRELTALFKSQDHVFDEQDTSVYVRQFHEMFSCRAPVVSAMDASLADLAQGVIDRLLARFTVSFNRMADPLANNMVSATVKDSEKATQRSLKDVSKGLTLRPTDELKQQIDAAAQESAGLIRRVPADYLPQVQGDVMRSITTGNGLADLVPALEARDVKIKNWAKNVAKDQTNKVFNNINKQNIQQAGGKKFEWIHSGGSNKPRKLHIDRAPDGLNGGIFRFDDPPIIDEKTGERGLPGQLPFCGCTMRPIFEFDDED